MDAETNTLTLSDSVFKKGVGTEAGGVFLRVIATLSNVTFEDTKLPITMKASTKVTFTGVTITGNVGRGISIESSTTVTMTRVSIDGNVNADTWNENNTYTDKKVNTGIYLSEVTNLIMNSCEIKNLQDPTTEGGGLNIRLPFISSESTMSATIDNLTLTNNYALNGGCMNIYSESSNKMLVKCTNCQLTKCFAANKGAGINYYSLRDAAVDAKVTFDSASSIKNSRARVEGGGIKYQWQKPELANGDSTFSDNFSPYGSNWASRPSSITVIKDPDQSLWAAKKGTTRLLAYEKLFASNMENYTAKIKYDMYSPYMNNPQEIELSSATSSSTAPRILD